MINISETNHVASIPTPKTEAQSKKKKILSKTIIQQKKKLF